MLILLPLTVIGQSTLECRDNRYPLTKVIDNDTVVLFTIKQEKCIYYWLEQKGLCEVELDISNVTIKAMNEHIDTLKSRIILKDLEINKYKSKSVIDNKRIVNLEEQVKVEENLQVIYVNEVKRVRNNRNKLYVVGGVLITGLSTALIISIIN